MKSRWAIAEIIVTPRFAIEISQRVASEHRKSLGDHLERRGAGSFRFGCDRDQGGSAPPIAWATARRLRCSSSPVSNNARVFDEERTCHAECFEHFRSKTSRRLPLMCQATITRPAVRCPPTALGREVEPGGRRHRGAGQRGSRDHRQYQDCKRETGGRGNEARVASADCWEAVRSAENGAPNRPLQRQSNLFPPKPV